MASLLRRLVAVAALCAGIGVAAGTATAAAAPVAHPVQKGAVHTTVAPTHVAHAADWWF